MSNRLTELEISQTLDKELTEFYQSRYIDSLPDDIIERFKDAVYHAAPSSHQVSVPLIRSIIKSPISELTVGQVGSIINVLRVTPLDWVYPDFFTAIDRHEELEKLTLRFNKAVDIFQKTLEKKRLSLLSLLPGRSNGGGMRIIPHS